VVEALVDGTVLEEDPDERDVESRAHCVVSLGRVCETLMGRLPPLTTPPTSTSGEAAEKAGESGSAPAEDGVEGALGSSEAESPTESAASGAQAPTQESRQAGVRLIVDKVDVYCESVWSESQVVLVPGRAASECTGIVYACGMDSRAPMWSTLSFTRAQLDHPFRCCPAC
jgi:hypothetical protein